jgi:hypothetical protein
MRAIGKGEETKNLNIIDNAHCIGMNMVILNWQRPLWEGD